MSSGEKRKSTSNVITIEIPPQNLQQKRVSRQFTHRFKKIQQADPQKESTPRVNMDNLDLFHYRSFSITEPTFKEQTPPKRDKNLSSYLMYKEEQKSLRSHSNKINALKLKYLQQRLVEKHEQRKEETERTKQEQPKKDRRVSLVMVGPTFETEIDEEDQLRRSRDVYMKTSEGKRQRVDTFLYFRKIKTKYDLKPKIQRSYVPSDPAFGIRTLYPVNSGSYKASFRRTLGSFRQRSVKRDKSKVDHVQEKETCRPWSSSKSEVFD